MKKALILIACITLCGLTPRYGGPHDFDFEFGTWKAHLLVQLHPMNASERWVHFDGISIVHPLLKGREDVGELIVRGPTGRIDGLTIRLYDPQTRQWNVSWVNAKDGTLTAPMIGGFSHGVGIFYGTDSSGGHPIVARFFFSHVTKTSFHFEQAFSSDGGKTWKTNWIATFTR